MKIICNNENDEKKQTAHDREKEKQFELTIYYRKLEKAYVKKWSNNFLLMFKYKLTKLISNCNQLNDCTSIVDRTILYICEDMYSIQ